MRSVILDDIDKIEKTHQHFSKNYIEVYLKNDCARYSENFNINGECLFQGLALFKSGIVFGNQQYFFLENKKNNFYSNIISPNSKLNVNTDKLNSSRYNFNANK